MTIRVRALVVVVLQTCRSGAARFRKPDGGGEPTGWRRLDLWLRSLHATGRTGEGVQRAEQAGLVFAFRARLLAIVVVSLWLLTIVPWPRDMYYLALAGGLFLLGYVPFLLRRHRYAEPIKLFFVVLDVALITTAVLMPPPVGPSTDWPVQGRIRGQEFLYLLLLLGEAALTFSPLRVLWTGLSIATVWSAGFRILYNLPDTTRSAEFSGPGPLNAAGPVRLYFEPTFVGLTNWYTQLVATSLLTALLTLAVLRSRMHLLTGAKAEVVRSDLARYVSPDVADALADPMSSGFGEPTTRHVAVLFADIVGFTGFTERLSPDRTFALLRSFQERSARIVLQHKGTLDKYLGDGLMATFGSLHEDEGSAGRAVTCAFALCDEMERWNAKRRDRQADPIRIAIGVHCGSVMVGNLGSEQRIEFTVVGDVVNVSSRLEKVTRDLACTLVVSDSCVQAAGVDLYGRRFDRIVDVQLRGRGEPLRVHVAGSIPASQALGV